MLSRFELEHLSVFYYIKDGILGRTFYQEVLNAPLVYDTRPQQAGPTTAFKIVEPSSAFGSFAVGPGRGWTYFDYSDYTNCEYVTSSGTVKTWDTPLYNHSFGIPQAFETSYIVVRDQAGQVIDRGAYEIDYRNGRVRYPCPTTPSGMVSSGVDPTSVDYRFNLVCCMDGWPEPGKVPDLPVLTINTQSDTQGGYQIGAGVQYDRLYHLVLFASSNAERRAIMDTLRNGLYNKHCPVIDFNRSGEPLKFWGVPNQDFFQTYDWEGKTYKIYPTLNAGNGHVLYFLDIDITYDATPAGDFSETMRYMGTLSFKSRTISEKDPDLVGKFKGLEEPPGGFDSLIQRGYSE